MMKLFKILIISAMMILQTHFVYAQSASILPPAQTTFVDKNGKPLTSGTVDFYVPGTTTRKMTWQDAGETIPNANPLTLDGSGRATILGDGSYRQVLKDRYGNIVWDGYTASTGSGGGGTTPTVGDGDAVGTVKAWSGFIAPYAYVFAYGQEITRASYPEVFAALTSEKNVSCTLGNATLTSISDTSQLAVGSAIESSCLNAGSTILSKTVNTVVASSNAIISTTSTARFFPYGNGDGTLTFNVPDLRGRAIAGRDNMGGVAANRLTSTYFGASAAALGVNGGNESQTLTIAQMPSHSHANTLTDPGHAHTVPFITTGSSGQTGGSAFTMGVGNQTTTLNTTGITINNVNTGGGAAHTIVQPTQTQNYIIKIIPDSNPNSFFGVASIGGMTGVITCGVGITCAGNNISAVNSSVIPPSSTVLGGVFSITCSSSNWMNTLDMTGTFGCSQPAFSNLTGTASVSQGGTGANVFTLNNPLLGNGTGPLIQGSRTGNTTNFATSTGTLINSHCVSIDANGNFVDNGASCATGSNVTPQNLNTILFASQFGQSDWCANLNAAISSLGSNAGTIIIDNNQTITTCSAVAPIALGNNHTVQFVSGGVYTLTQTIVIGIGNYISGITGGNISAVALTDGTVLKWSGASSTPMIKFFNAEFSTLRNLGLDCNGVTSCFGIWMNSDNSPSSHANLLEHFEVTKAEIGIIIGSDSTSAVSGASCSSNTNQSGCSQNDNFIIQNFQIFGNCAGTTSQGIRINSLNAAQFSFLGYGNVQCANIGVRIINMNDSFTITGVNLGSVIGTTPTTFYVESSVINGPDFISNETEAGTYAVQDYSAGGTSIYQGNQFNQIALFAGAANKIVSTSNIYSAGIQVSGGTRFTSSGDVITGTPTLTGTSALLKVGFNPVVAVASLPACSSFIQQQKYMVNNATDTTFWTIVAGGGANTVPVVCDGSNWRIGG